jgi:hypothetical protein
MGCADRGSGRPVVLVVEEDGDVRNVIRGFLQDLHTIVEASDGKEALWWHGQRISSSSGEAFAQSIVDR